jgi:plasmid stabilization system protein ParE
VAHPVIRSHFQPGQASHRGRVIPEAKELGFPARHLLFGKGNGVYRIIFHVQKDEQHVRVLRIWHASRDAITSADVEE